MFLPLGSEDPRMSPFTLVPRGSCPTCSFPASLRPDPRKQVLDQCHLLQAAALVYSSLAPGWKTLPCGLQSLVWGREPGTMHRCPACAVDRLGQEAGGSLLDSPLTGSSGSPLWACCPPRWPVLTPSGPPTGPDTDGHFCQVVV